MSHSNGRRPTADDVLALIDALPAAERRRLFDELEKCPELSEQWGLLRALVAHALDQQDRLSRKDVRTQQNVAKVLESYRLQAAGVKVAAIAERLGWSEKELGNYRRRHRVEVLAARLNEKCPAAVGAPPQVTCSPTGDL
jgi:hypothetical protein